MQFLLDLDDRTVARGLTLIESLFERSPRELDVIVVHDGGLCERVLARLRMPQLHGVTRASLGLASAAEPRALLAAWLERGAPQATVVALAPSLWFFADPAELERAATGAVAASDDGSVVLARAGSDARALAELGPFRGRPCAPLGALRGGDVVHAGGAPVVCGRFDEVSLLGPGLAVPSADGAMALSAVGLCAAYVDALARAVAVVRSVEPGWSESRSPRATLGEQQSFLAWHSARSMFDARRLPHERMAIGASWDAYLGSSCERDAPPLERRFAAPVPDAQFDEGPLGAPANPRVSALVSTYASARFLRGCLDDLLEQTLYRRGELEIVVVDSGSPENEAAIVAEYQQRHRGIRYLRTARREGVFMAWNRAAEAARGCYLSNANTDDRHHPLALERLAAELDAYPEVGLVYADSLIGNEENARFDQAKPCARFAWPEFERVQLLYGCFIGPQPMWRRAVHEAVGWFDARYRVAGDYEMWLRVAERFPMRHVRETLGLYLAAEQSVEHANRDVCGLETASVASLYAPRAGVTFSRERVVVSYAVPPSEADAAAQRHAAEIHHAKTFDCALVLPLTGGRSEVEALLTEVAAHAPEGVDFQVVLVDVGMDEEAHAFVRAAVSGDVVHVEAQGEGRERALARAAASVTASSLLWLEPAAVRAGRFAWLPWIVKDAAE